MKRFFTLTLMLFCFMLHGFAFDYTDENGLTWTCTINEDDNNTIAISGSNNNEDIKEISVPECIEYEGKTYTTTIINKLYSKAISVILPKSIKTIANGAFYGCWNLININLSNVKTIEDEAFFDCKSLKCLNLANVETIGGGAFGQCYITGKVELSDKLSQIENFYTNADTVIIHAINVPVLTSSFSPQTVILVPSIALNNYKKADVWNNSTQIFAIGTKTVYDVKTTALSDAPGLLQVLDRDSLSNIVTLKVSGTINGYDIMLFRNKMDNLHHLDLSDADIVANPYEYYEGYATENDVLGEYSFSRINYLTSIILPKNLKEIRSFAFEDCSNLNKITFPNNQAFKLVGQNIFCGCYSLKEITLPDGLEYIPRGCFQVCGLKHVDFPPSLKRIEAVAFYGCDLDSLNLPGVTYIEGDAFKSNRNLKELRVPSTLEKIEGGAFSDCNLEKVYAYTVLPISISQGTFDNFSNISLYVPTQSVDNYYLNTQWSQFKEIHEFNEPYKYFYLDKEFTLEDKRFDGTPDIDIKEDGGLKVDGKDNQEAGDVTIKGDGDKGNSGTLITDGNLNAKKMRFDISVSDNKWYFFSFPFDIKLSDTKAPGEYKWKMYDGSIRADQGSGGWVNLPDNEEWFKQGKGYIFQTNKAGTLTLKVTKEKFGQLDANNIMKELDVFPSGNNFDASWNFIGNPQTSYYNVNDLGYEAPITVWNGNSYEAVRPGDDDYTLHPFQAFFVQKPTASSTIEFKAEDRLTKTGSEIRAQETKARRLARGFVPSRMIINLNVSDGSLSDKTRVVFNDKKSRNYEMDCDAAKFMTLTNAPQLYSVEGKGTKFAINERPMGSVQLGFTAKKSGTFTISAVRMDQPMLLKDNVAGITIDLTNGDYEFTSEAGTFNKRFLLTPNSSVTSIADVVKKTGVNILPTEEGIQINGCNGKNVDVYNLNGAQVASSNSDGMLRLSAGVYIVKVNGMSTKVMVK